METRVRNQSSNQLAARLKMGLGQASRDFTVSLVRRLYRSALSLPFHIRPLQFTFTSSPFPSWRWCLVNVVAATTTFTSTGSGAFSPTRARDIRVRVRDL